MGSGRPTAQWASPWGIQGLFGPQQVGEVWKRRDPSLSASVGLPQLILSAPSPSLVLLGRKLLSTLQHERMASTPGT